MEGTQVGQKDEFPLAYSWSPGWNSNQSNHKFHDEYRGDGLVKQAGVRCIETNQSDQWFKWQAAWSINTKAQWQILPLQKVFGSDNLSLHALPIAQIKVQAQIVVRPMDAEKLGFTTGQLIYCDDNQIPLQLLTSSQVPANSLLVYVPADQLFELHNCEQLIAATAKQNTAYNTQISQQQTQQQLVKQHHQERLLAQDQTIPIHFIKGVI
jgi:NADH-quinone oxidoreductase subunit G